MKKVILIFEMAAVLAMGLIGESQAVTCNFEADTNGNYKLSVIGDSGGSTFSSQSCDGQLPQGKFSWSDVKSSISSVEFDDNVIAVDNAVFGWAGDNLKSVYMPNVRTVGNVAFTSTGLETVYMPNVETIGDDGFSSTKLTSVDMPNITSLGDGAFYGVSTLSYIGITSDIPIGSMTLSGTQVSNCGYHGEYGSNCGSCGDGYIMSGRGCVTADTCEISSHYKWDANTNSCNPIQTTANDVTPGAGTQPTTASCTGQGKVLQGKECVASCGSSFRLNDGECDRIRYTPAEAAQYLKDTDNEIIMTFKVNR